MILTFLSIIFALLIVTAVCLVFIVFSPQLIRLFMDNEKVVEYGSWFLGGFCAGMPFLCIDYAAVNVFQGCGEIDLPQPEGIAARWFFIKAGCGKKRSE